MADGGPRKRGKRDDVDGEAGRDPRALDATWHIIERLGEKFSRHWLSNPADRAEVAQEVALAIWDRATADPNWLVPGQPLEKIVRSYTRNKAADRLRANYAERASLPEYERRELERGRVQLDTALLFDAAEAEEIMERSLRNVARAPREVWRAIERQGMTRNQVATQRGVSVNTIRAQYYQASCVVRLALAKYAGGGA